MAGAYTGAATRQARMSARPPVPGVNSDHTTPQPEPDPFNPVPDRPLNQTGTIWTADDPTAGQSNQPNMAQGRISHWWQGRPPVPTNVPENRSDQEFQDRFVDNHSVVSGVIPDSRRGYFHQGQGHWVEWQVGRAPREAGITVPENAEWLIVGKNSYDRVNQPNEVYTGSPENVGRYRLGLRNFVAGVYSMPLAKNGQDAQLHSYTGLYPALPVDKPRIENAAPYTRNSGTAHWDPAPPAQVPSMFSLPSETAVTDYSTATNAPGSDFLDRSEFF